MEEIRDLACEGHHNLYFECRHEAKQVSYVMAEDGVIQSASLFDVSFCLFVVLSFSETTLPF